MIVPALMPRIVFAAAVTTWLSFVCSATAVAAGDAASRPAEAEDHPTAADPRLEHWTQGQLYYDGQWMSYEDAVRRGSSDQRLAEYRRLRDQSADTLDAHRRLARWAAREKLPELADVHWMHVLRLAPHYPAALRALEMRWSGGVLMTDADAERLERERRQTAKAAKAWRPQAKQLRRQLVDADPQNHVAARATLQQIDDPAATAALVDELMPKAATDQATRRLRIALAEALGRIDGPMALDVLLDLALTTENDQLRYAVLDNLRQKPWEQFMPRLLAELRLPVEGTMASIEQGNQLVSQYSYEQEGPDGQTYENSYLRATPVAAQKYSSADLYHTRQIRPERVIPAHRGPCGMWIPEKKLAAEYRTDYLTTVYGGELPGYAAARQAARGSLAQQAASFGDELGQINARLANQNARVASVLRDLTGETIDAAPKAWWNWWRDYVQQQPDLAAATINDRFQAAILEQQPRGLSRGSFVWTLRGQRPIEKVAVGDFVLSQNLDSGELAFKPVLAALGGGVQEVVEVSLGGDRLTCAPGQSFWSQGEGWRRASDVDAETRLHGVTGGRSAESIRETYALDVYHLVVKDFHTLFIGKAGVLAHDFSPVQPAAQMVPGVAAAR